MNMFGPPFNDQPKDLQSVIQNAYTVALENLAKKIEDSGRVIAPGADIEWTWDEQGTHLTATVDTIPRPS